MSVRRMNFVELHSSQWLSCRILNTPALIQTCQPLVKENLEAYKKISGHSSKSSENQSFSSSNPFSIEETRHQSHSQGVTPFQKWRTEGEKNDKLY